MTLAEEYFDHANMLLWRGSEPSRVDVRRAISAAYYGLFHALTESGAKLSRVTSDEVRNQIRRAYNHGTMRKACEIFGRLSARPAPPPYDVIIPEAADPRLFEVAAGFVELQEARNRADYDMLSTLSVFDADRLVAVGERALRQFRDIEYLPETAVFLTALLLADRWPRRG